MPVPFYKSLRVTPTSDNTVAKASSAIDTVNYLAVRVALLAYEKHSTEQLNRCFNILDIDHFVVLPYEMPILSYTHIVLAGGNNLSLPNWVIQSSAPVLGIGAGFESIAQHCGATLRALSTRDRGIKEIIMTHKGHHRHRYRWCRRNYEIYDMPNSFTIQAINVYNQIMACTDRVKWWGIHFHPEDSHARDMKVLRDFFRVTTWVYLWFSS